MGKCILALIFILILPLSVQGKYQHKNKQIEIHFLNVLFLIEFIFLQLTFTSHGWPYLWHHPQRWYGMSVQHFRLLVKALGEQFSCGGALSLATVVEYRRSMGLVVSVSSGWCYSRIFLVIARRLWNRYFLTSWNIYGGRIGDLYFVVHSALSRSHSSGSVFLVRLSSWFFGTSQRWVRFRE